MTELQKEFEANGYTSWINADLYPDGKIYTQEYTQWLERQVLALRQPPVSVSVCPKCGSTDLFKSQKAELYDCKCCGLRWANER
jgi:ribosomal protein L37AE/L43A